ncbi:hypothetical protein [Dyadobacter pollutisoli]|uniref:DUF4386 family protein n=1 Tax=Dyadobacter pollutisoli TaxID=2910158 RepID=A0A9E8SPY1_9BACT|nr:hypothetical protein [Dyadobacter pollutisoli]WAC15196.1 hypothetical protein ON006_14755 [Dyadobacter pollutisoli]
MQYRVLVGFICILSAILSIACLGVGVISVDYDFEAFSNPQLVLYHATHYRAAYWFNILDMFGYYLLVLPLIMYCHQQYKFRSPWLGTFTVCGIAYIVVGAIGAAALAVAWESLLQLHLTAEGTAKETIEIVFVTITTIVTKGFWNILETLFATVWFAGAGRFLYNENKFLGALGVITGAGTLLDGAGNIAGLNGLAEIGLNIYLLFSIAFIFVAGVVFITRR